MRSPSSQSCKSVLIVDDNPWIRKVLCERFQREAGVAVCGEAENGKEAIEKAQQLRPELIVLDLSMPVMNGLDAARILRRLMPSVPLIMYSAFGDKLIERQARLIGIRELVPKSQDAAEIGRASCRERVEMSGVEEAVADKKRMQKSRGN